MVPPRGRENVLHLAKLTDWLSLVTSLHTLTFLHTRHSCPQAYIEVYEVLWSQRRILPVTQLLVDGANGF
jgi:hypothetical protein